jgi:creatinine amidohydrolase
MDEWVLSEQNYHFIKSVKWEAAVLPFGATEPHNYHMPYGTDVFQVEQIGRRACGIAYRQGAKVLLLPAVPFGVNTNHMKVPGGLAMSITPTTLLKIIGEIAESLEAHGVRKLVLLNGHGGNELKPLMRELHHKSGVFMCLCDWYRMVEDVRKETFERPGEHADEMETSLGLAFFPQFMKMELAGSGEIVQSKLDGIRKGWIQVTRPWHLASKDTGMGDPSKATKEKGERLMQATSERLGAFLLELCRMPMSERFPY